MVHLVYKRICNDHREETIFVNKTKQKLTNERKMQLSHNKRYFGQTKT